MKFAHELIEIPDLISDTTDKGRYYQVKPGVWYPSVTTVLGAMPKSQGLIEWRQKVGEEAADRIMRDAGLRGTEVHEMVEYYLNNRDFVMKYSYDSILLWHNIKPILDKYVNNIRVQEAALYSDFLKVAGRVDCVADFNGKLSIIDFKTSRSPKKEEWIQSYFMQAAAYAVMFEERTEIPVTNLVILVTGTFGHQVFVKKRDDYIKEFMELRVKFEKDFLKLQGDS